MTEYTQEQVDAIKATESALLDFYSALWSTFSDGAWSETWRVASALAGRDLDVVTIGELQRLVLQETR